MRKNLVPAFLIVITAAFAAFEFSDFSPHQTDDKHGAQIEKSYTPGFYSFLLAEEENGSEESSLKKISTIHLSRFPGNVYYFFTKHKEHTLPHSFSSLYKEKFLLHRQFLI